LPLTLNLQINHNYFSQLTFLICYTGTEAIFKQEDIEMTKHFLVPCVLATLTFLVNAPVLAALPDREELSQCHLNLRGDWVDVAGRDLDMEQAAACLNAIRPAAGTGTGWEVSDEDNDGIYIISTRGPSGGGNGSPPPEDENTTPDDNGGNGGNTPGTDDGDNGDDDDAGQDPGQDSGPGDDQSGDDSGDDDTSGSDDHSDEGEHGNGGDDDNAGGDDDSDHGDDDADEGDDDNGHDESGDEDDHDDDHGDNDHDDNDRDEGGNCERD